MTRHPISPDNADLFRGWIATRGGIALWKSINLSNPAASWLTPAKTSDGQPTPRPNWQADTQPAKVFTSESELSVSLDREVKRFRVAIRRSSNGLMMKVTDAGSAKIRREVEKAGAGAYHVFDYGTQEAVIFAQDRTVPLEEWHP